jgi:hypothetical protein
MGATVIESGDPHRPAQLKDAGTRPASVSAGHSRAKPAPAWLR